MARKTLEYAVLDEGRDKGKTFLITEMPAAKAESWAMRALLAMMQSGAEMPEGFERAGMAGMAEVGLRALSGIRWEVAKPLLDEMMECVQIIPDITRPQVVRKLVDDDTEEVATRIKLRGEVWNLHVGFLQAAKQSA